MYECMYVCMYICMYASLSLSLPSREMIKMIKAKRGSQNFYIVNETREIHHQGLRQTDFDSMWHWPAPAPGNACHEVSIG